MEISEELEINRYKNWIYTMKLENFKTKEYNLLKECSNLLLLYIFDFLEPEKIKWKMIEKNPNNKYRKLANFNHFFSKMKEKNLDFTSIGSNDIVEGKKNKIFSLLWALMRYNFFLNFKKEKKIMKIDEIEIKKWAEKFNYSNLKKKSAEKIKEENFKNEKIKEENFKNEKIQEENFKNEKIQEENFKKTIFCVEDKNDDILACEDRELFYNEIIKEDFGFTINFDDFDKDLKSFEKSKSDIFNFSLTEKFDKDYKKIEILAEKPNNMVFLNKFNNFVKKIDYFSNIEFVFKKKDILPIGKLYKKSNFITDKKNKLKKFLNLNFKNINLSKAKKKLKIETIIENKIENKIKITKIDEIKIKNKILKIEKIKKIENVEIINTLKLDCEESILFIPREKRKSLSKKKTKSFSDHKESVLLFIKTENKEKSIISNFEDSLKKKNKTFKEKKILKEKKNFSNDLKNFFKKTNLNCFFYLKNNLLINDLLKKKIYKLIIQKKCYNLLLNQKEENLSTSISKIKSSDSFKKKFENLNSISKRNKILFPLILQRKMSLKNKKIEEICQNIKKIGILNKKEIFYDSKKIEDIKLLKPYYYNIVMKKIVNRNNEKIFNFPKSTVILKEYKNNKKKFTNFKEYLEHCFQ